jgi:HEAT repeat protein
MHMEQGFFILLEKEIYSKKRRKPEAKVIDAIIHTLADPDEDVRVTTAVALAKMREIRATAGLYRLMHPDTNQEISSNDLPLLSSMVAQQAIANQVRVLSQMPWWPG